MRSQELYLQNILTSKLPMGQISQSVSPSRLCQLKVRPEPNPVKNLKGRAPGHTQKHLSSLESPAGDKHPSLFDPFVSCEEKSFVNTASARSLGRIGLLLGQCYKTFYVRNLRFFILSQNVCQTRLEKLARDKCCVKTRKLRT